MNTFTNTRTLPARPEAVFAALTTPERLARWWGPAGFSNRFAVCEVRPGGRWVFDMIGPDGTVYANESVFQHIEPNRQVVVRHTCAPLFTLSITLEPVAEGTQLHWQQVFDDAAFAQAAAHILVPANEQNLDRLQAELQP